ncbi:MAG: class I adenylate-forming enzyme family protein [Sulfolobaceae archaeon]
MSLATVLYKNAKEYPNSIFLIGERELTYQQALDEVRKRASIISPGDTVVHLMFNSVDSILNYLSIFWAGGKVIALDPLTTSEDLKQILEDADPDLIITDEEIRRREKNILNGYKVITEIQPRSLEISRPYEYREDEVGLIYYYAGIAGRTMQVLHSANRVELNSAVLSAAIGLKEVRALLTVPLAHVLGNSILGVTLESSGTLVIMKKFDPRIAAELINKYQINYLSTVPLVYDYLNQIDNSTLNSLELCVSSAAPLSKTTVDTFKKKYGKNIVQQYGFTEGLILTFQPKEYSDIITIGKPLENVKIKVVKEDGKEAKVGEVGELYVKAPWLMLGYKDPVETSKVFQDGWLKTGDLVSYDERGFLYFKGVKKRMIKFKGYPIFPRDLEEIIKTHPLVIDAKVIGEDAGEFGQQPIAKVIVKERREGIEEELLNYVNSKVALYKRLKRVDLVDKLE